MFDVGAVVGRLEMNIKGWNTAVDTVKKDQKSLSGLVLRHQDDIKKLGTAFTVAGGAITGMFGLLLKKTVDAGDQINDLSKRTGIATETLSAYKLAADQSGTSLEGMATGFRGLARVMNDANTGLAEAKRAFDQLGVAYTDNEGKLRPLDQVMLDVADRFAAMPDGAQKTALAMELFGRSGMELIPMLNMGRQGLEENAEAARRLGMVWSQEAAAKADEFNDKVAELQAGLAGAGREIVTALLPSVQGLIEKVRDVAVGVREWAAEYPVLAGWISKIALGLGGLMVATGPLLIALPKLVLGFQALKKLEIGQKIAGQFKGLGDEVSGLSGALKKLPAIGAAAFLGWEIGKLIGDVTGLDHAIEGLASKVINKFGLWKGSAEEVDLTTERLAKRQLFLGTASDIAGREITNLGEAIDIIKGAYEKSGTVGNKTLDDWAAKSNAADAATQRLSGGVSGLSKLFQDLGIKTRTELVKELNDARSALDQLRGSSESTPGAVQALQDKIKGLSEELYGADKAGEAFNQWIDGLTPKLSETTTWLGKVDRMFAEGKLSEAQYAEAMKYLSGEFDKLGIKINRVLPPSRDFRDLISQTGVALEDEAWSFASAESAVRSWASELDVGTDKVIAAQLELANLKLVLMGLPPLLPEIGGGMTLMATEGKTAALEVDNAFSGLWNNIAQGFGNTVTEWIRGATTFKQFMDGLWQDILQGFTQWIGQKLTEKMVGFFDGLLSNAKKTGEGVVGTVQSLTSGAAEMSKAATGAISGVWMAAGTAIGSFLGTTLASVFGGGPSGHQQQQEINDTKDSRNFLADIKNWLFSAGSGFGGAVWDYSQKFTNEKIDEAKGFIAEVKDALAPRIDETNGWLRSIDGRGGDIARALGNLPKAASGRISTRTELVEVHGTPAKPEYIGTSEQLAGMAGPGASAGAGGGSKEIRVSLTININGTVVAPKEHIEKTLLPGIVNAVKSGVQRAQLQAALGVA